MKIKYFTLVLLLASSSFFCQNNKIDKAHQLFETNQFVSAIDAYLEIVNSNQANTKVYKGLADSYYTIFNPTEAAKWYAKATENEVDAETHFRYAQSLKSIGNLAEAKNQMTLFSKKSPKDSRAKEFMSSPNFSSEMNTRKSLFDVTPTTVSSNKTNDFSPVLSNDNVLYFVSTRNNSKTDKSTNLPYLDIYQSIRSTEGVLSEATIIKELQTSYHDGPVAVSADGNTMYFARDGFGTGLFEKNKSSNVKIGQLGIYKTTKINGKWSDVVALPINSASYSTSHPALSVDGKTLYFTSNMPGGFGETDIWKISISASGYGSPENLGDQINTSGREAFAYATSSALYFASSGKQGFGGLDVFKYDTNSGQISNLGKPVNSEKDDFSFSFNEKFNVAYFASNRSGSDMIYNANPVCSVASNVVVLNKSNGKIIENASLSVIDNTKKSIEIESDKTGKFYFGANCNATYVLNATAIGFESNTKNISTTKTKDASFVVELEPTKVIITDKEVLLDNIYFEFNNSFITAQGAAELDKLVQVMNEFPAMIIYVKAHTDSKGSVAYNAKLSDQRAQSTVQYVISKGISMDRISGKGVGSAEPKINCKSNCTDEQHALNRRSEFLIVKNN
jgi:outer membrane protein OmpA-like peptidoglycan-associated protein